MNVDEHALAVIIEECAEIILCAAKVQQSATKALRFGLDDGYPETDRTNRADLVSECNDLLGALEHLTERQELEGLYDRDQIEAKKIRIKCWHQHAMNTGALQE